MTEGDKPGNGVWDHYVQDMKSPRNGRLNEQSSSKDQLYINRYACTAMDLVSICITDEYIDRYMIMLDNIYYFCSRFDAICTSQRTAPPRQNELQSVGVSVAVRRGSVADDRGVNTAPAATASGRIPFPSTSLWSGTSICSDHW